MTENMTILVGTVGQGVLRSADGGENWGRVGIGQGLHSDAVVRTLATHQSKQSGFSRTSNTAANTSSYRNNPVYSRGVQNRTSYDNYYAGRDRYYGGMGWSGR